MLDDTNIYIPFKEFGKYLSTSATKVYSEHETDVAASFFQPKDLPFHAHNSLKAHKG